jgi:hypothetical protein
MPMMKHTSICIVLLQKTGEKFQKIAAWNIAEECAHRIWLTIPLNSKVTFEAPLLGLSELFVGENDEKQDSFNCCRSWGYRRRANTLSSSILVMILVCSFSPHYSVAAFRHNLRASYFYLPNSSFQRTRRSQKLYASPSSGVNGTGSSNTGNDQFVERMQLRWGEYLSLSKKVKRLDYFLIAAGAGDTVSRIGHWRRILGRLQKDTRKVQMSSPWIRLPTLNLL